MDLLPPLRPFPSGHQRRALHNPARLWKKHLLYRRLALFHHRRERWLCNFCVTFICCKSYIFLGNLTSVIVPLILCPGALQNASYTDPRKQIPALVLFQFCPGLPGRLDPRFFFFSTPKVYQITEKSLILPPVVVSVCASSELLFFDALCAIVQQPAYHGTTSSAVCSSALPTTRIVTLDYHYFPIEKNLSHSLSISTFRKSARNLLLLYLDNNISLLNYTYLDCHDTVVAHGPRPAAA